MRKGWGGLWLRQISRWPCKVDRALGIRLLCPWGWVFPRLLCPWGTGFSLLPLTDDRTCCLMHQQLSQSQRRNFPADDKLLTPVTCHSLTPAGWPPGSVSFRPCPLSSCPSPQPHGPHWAVGVCQSPLPPAEVSYCDTQTHTPDNSLCYLHTPLVSHSVTGNSLSLSS